MLFYYLVSCRTLHVSPLYVYTMISMPRRGLRFSQTIKNDEVSFRQHWAYNLKFFTLVIKPVAL
jgi:hypothetical protein